jgi:hypothetical protein
VEASLAILLRIVSDVDAKVAPAIFSGTRADQARSFIKRILDARKEPLDPALKRAFDQFGVINSTRNDIVHYGAQFGEDEMVVANHLAAHTPEALRRHVVSPETLNDMSADLATIQAAIAVALLSKGPIEVIPIREEFRELALAPWRYRPSPPPPRPKNSGEPHQAQ